MSGTKTINAAPPAPLHGTLVERLNACHQAANDAWAAKASTGFRDTVGALAAVVRGFDVRSAEITDHESLLRMRSELAEALRSAASAIAPRVS